MPRRHPRTEQRRGRRQAPARDAGESAEHRARQQAICSAKAAYASEAEARSHVLMHRPNGGPGPVPYRCDVCDLWHLTGSRR